MLKRNYKNMFLSPNKNKNIFKVRNNSNKIKRRDILTKGYKGNDERLSLTLSILGLSNIMNLFNEKNISFIDLLLLSKETMKELELEMYQRNRLFNFATSFTKFSKNYTMEDLLHFFEGHQQFLFDKKIYENKVIKSNIEFIDNNKNKENNVINNENENDNNNIYITPRYNQKINRKYEHNTHKKSSKGKNMLKKYLSLKKDVDEFLNKLIKQKEDTQILTYKYGNFIKKLNFYGGNENDIINSEEKNNKRSNINKLLEKIKILENKKIDQKTFEHLIQIKNYVIEREESLMMEEIIKLENEIEKMIELNLKKEKLKNNLQICEKNIKENSNLINQLNNESNNINDNDYN